MSELIRFATESGIHTIHANLSLVDSGHKNRVHAFYKNMVLRLLSMKIQGGLSMER